MLSFGSRSTCLSGLRVTRVREVVGSSRQAHIAWSVAGAQAQFSMAAQVSLDDVEMTTSKRARSSSRRRAPASSRTLRAAAARPRVPRHAVHRRAGVPGRARRLGARPGGGGTRQRGARLRRRDARADRGGRRRPRRRRRLRARRLGQRAGAEQAGAKRQRAADDEVAAACPLQLGTARFRSLAWSAPGAAPYQRALCATVAHTTVVLDTPNSSMEWKLQVLAHLAPRARRRQPGAAPYNAHTRRAGVEAEQLQMRVARRVDGRARAGGRRLLRRARRRLGAGGRARRPRQRRRTSERTDARVVATRRQRWRGFAAVHLRRLARRRRHRWRSSSAMPTADPPRAAPAVGRWRAGGRRVAPHRRAVAAARHSPCALAAGSGVQLLCASGPLVLAYEIDTGGGDGGAAHASLVAQHAHAQYVTSLAALPHGRGYLSASVDGVLQHQHTAAATTTTAAAGVVVDGGLAASRGGAQDGVLGRIRRGAPCRPR